MPTPSEQKALAFVAMVVLLGGAVRIVRAGPPHTPTSLEQQALARQASAADSASDAAPTRRKSRARPSRKGRGPAGTTDGGASAPARSAATAAPLGPMGFPPPGPRIDVEYRSNRFKGGPEVRSADGSSIAPPAPPLDLDRASVQEIEALPRVGPAIARRIVANRDSLGDFGSLDALGRVKGMGPATRKHLAPLVTFSGRASSRP